MMRSKKIAFITPYPFDTAPGPRFRYEQYLFLLKGKGWTLLILPFLSFSTYTILYKRGFALKKVIGVFSGYLKRIVHLFQVLSCDYVFIYREASPLGYPVFEWIISKVFRKKLIYDFDDAIWMENVISKNKFLKKFKYSRKVGYICQWSYKVSVGNRYLQDYALGYNKNSVLNPTTIDTQNYHNAKNDQNTFPVVIGWTGSHSTVEYLDMIYPVLKKLNETVDFSFHVIADKEVNFDLKNFVFKKWNKERELEDLLQFNIGIMPLPDTEWSRGKCGFKALQYMSLGIPAVVSPVGVNLEIVSEGVNGFCCATEEEWFQKLALLIDDINLRKKMGAFGIERVKSRYSTQSNANNFLSLFS